MNRRSFNLSLLGLMAGCGGTDVAQEYVIRPSPIRSGYGINSPISVYRELDFTPVLSCQTPGDLSVAYTSQLGRITQIGKVVLLECYILTSTFTHTTASGDVRITGVPSDYIAPTLINRTGPTLVTGANLLAGTTHIQVYWTNALTYLSLAMPPSGGGGPGINLLAITAMPTNVNKLVTFSIQYSLDSVI